MLFRSACATQTWEDCGNNWDDDGDGWVDCQDPDCMNTPGCGQVDYEYDCSNGLDDDWDGAVDCADPDCMNTPECGQVEYEYDCSNRWDDDWDGLIDCQDPDCMNTPECGVISPEDCGNGLDDDWDGLVDCADDECLWDPGCFSVGDCDAVDLSGCSLPMQTCYFQRSDYLGHCMWVSGSAGIGASCQTETDCQPGLFCNGADKRCLKLCHVGNNADCNAGQTCRTVQSWNGSPYGGCL